MTEAAEPVEPLDAPIESTLSHDPYVNRAFIAIFSHDENADIARAFTVGLPINDPPVADDGVAEDEEFDEDEEGEPEAPVDLVSRRIAAYRDPDGDQVDIIHYPGREAVVFGVNGVAAAVVPSADLDPIISLLCDAYDAATAEVEEVEE